MKGKTIVIALIACFSLASCAEEMCPANSASSRPEYSFRKKVKFKYGSTNNKKRKPTPSLIHITRVNYKPGSNK